MSENTHIDPQPEESPETLATQPGEPEAEASPETPQEPESTIGTGTSMALGCIAGTVLLIGFGLLFLFISTLR